MKKLFVLIFVLGSVFTVTAQKATKIGHINSAELLAAMPERGKIQKELEDYAKQLQQQLEAMQAEWQTKMQEFKSKEGQMSEVIRNAKIKEITDLEARMQEFQETAQEDLQKKRNAVGSTID